MLGEDRFGVYLVGSFAVGDADEHSDVDVLVPVARPLTAAQQAELRAFHAELPGTDGHRNRELEGSYPPVEELRTLAGLGRHWLYVDRGATEMEWSAHCTTPEHRWTLRHRGVALTGPPPDAVVDGLPPGALREDMRRRVPSVLDSARTWVDVDRVAWGQRYVVPRSAGRCSASPQMPSRPSGRRRSGRRRSSRRSGSRQICEYRL